MKITDFLKILKSVISWMITTEIYHIRYFFQCGGSVTLWYGSDLQDANKKSKFFCLLL
jgi:hypothetical protein